MFGVNSVVKQYNGQPKMLYSYFGTFIGILFTLIIYFGTLQLFGKSDWSAVMIVIISFVPVFVSEYICNKSTRLFAPQVIQPNRHIFLATGVLYTFLWMVLQSILPPALNMAKMHAVLLSLLLVVLALLYAVLPFKIQQEDSDQNRIKYFSSDRQLHHLYSYFFAGAVYPLMLISFAQSVKKGYTRIIIDSTDIELFFMIFSFHILLLLLSVVGQRIISRYGIQNIQWRKVSTLLIVAFLLQLLFLTNSSVANFWIFYLLTIVLQITFLLRAQNLQKICSNCTHELTGSNCTYCATASMRLPLPELRKTVHPQCPSCKTNWSTLSRKCENCGLLILLKCPHCQQTINPLWETCIHCHQQLERVPERALTLHTPTMFAKAMSTTIIFLGIAIVLLINESVNAYFVYLALQLDGHWENITYYDNLLKSGMEILVVIATLSILYTYNNNKAIAYYAIKLFTQPLEVFIIGINLIFILIFLQKSYPLIFTILAIIWGVLILYRFRVLFSNVQNYTPVIAFTPSRSRKNMRGENT